MCLTVSHSRCVPRQTVASLYTSRWNPRLMAYDHRQPLWWRAFLFKFARQYRLNWMAISILPLWFGDAVGDWDRAPSVVTWSPLLRRGICHEVCRRWPWNCRSASAAVDFSIDLFKYTLLEINNHHFIFGTSYNYRRVHNYSKIKYAHFAHLYSNMNGSSQTASILPAYSSSFTNPAYASRTSKYLGAFFSRIF